MPSTVERTVRGHIPSLDGIRGIAILWVVLHNVDLLTVPQSLSTHVVGFIADRGYTGVTLFFVLSGFLITGALLDSQKAVNYYQAFFWRRFVRIFPLYYIVLIIAFGLVPLVASLPAETLANYRNQIWLWTYLSNWFQPFGYYVHGFSHFWSLAVEEQFYLLWPFAVHRLSKPGVIKLSCAVIAFALISRVVIRALGADAEVVYEFTICRMDALACGAIVAAITRMPAVIAWIEQSSRKVLLATAGVLLLGAVLTRAYERTGLSGQILGYAILAAGFGALILLAVMSEAHRFTPVSRVLSWAPLRMFGKYSYGMYVFHRLLQGLIGERLQRAVGAGGKPDAFHDLAYVLLFGLVTFALAFLSYHAVEKHFLRLKRLVAVRATTPEPA